ncbi:PREDICTED: myelin-associated glycoprotein, partial [Nipponia nippon]|uniref:myelin-associated glycoprotein n=1 Tax=Nipponia nippon TaxID=128390 RepID=UPI000510C1CB
EPVLEVPPELVAGEEVELRCRVPDNCPQLRPRVGWEGTEELPEASQRELREDAAGAGTILALLRFRPRREDGGRRLGCKVAFANSTLAFEATVALDVQFPPILLPDSRCTPGGDGARCVCSASAIPEPAVTFDLPSRNVTVTEGHRDYTVTTPGQGTGGVVTVTGILTLRGTLDPRLAVLCSAHNPHGSVRQQLRFHHPGTACRLVTHLGVTVACHRVTHPGVTVTWCHLLGTVRPPPPKPGRGPPEEPPEYAEIRVK